MGTVVKPWVNELPWKQQSALFSALRGPDNVLCPGIKRIVRWLRSVTQNNADATGRVCTRVLGIGSESTLGVS